METFSKVAKQYFFHWIRYWFYELLTNGKSLRDSWWLNANQWFCWSQRIIVHRDFKKMCRKIIFLFCIVFTYSFLIYIVETSLSMLDMAEHATQTISTVGYGKVLPVTRLGRIINIIFLFHGGIYFLISSGSIIVVYQLKNSLIVGGLMQFLKRDSIILIGVPAIYKLKKMIAGIQKANPNTTICIVSEDINSINKQLIGFSDIEYIESATNDIDKIKNEIVNLEQQKSIIVYPEIEIPEADITTIYKVSRLSKLIGPDCTLAYVLIDSSNEDMFRDYGAVQINEYNEMALSALSCNSPFVVKAIQETMNNNKGIIPFQCEIKNFIGLTWQDLLLGQIKYSNAEENVPQINIQSLVRAGEISLIPDFGTKFKDGDIITLAAHENFDWDEYESKIFEYTKTA